MMTPPPIPTPPQITITPAPPPISERAVLADGIGRAESRARALGATLGVVVIDLTTGARAERNGDENMPMDGAQEIALKVLRDHGGDVTDAEAANARLRAMGYPTIFIAANDAGYATPDALARLVSSAVTSDESIPPAPDVGIATLGGRTYVAVAIVHGGELTNAQRAAVLRDIRQAIADAANADPSER